MTREEYFSKLSRAFELLGNPLRLKIFMRILSQGCDCDLAEQDGITGNCVSGIMKELKLPQSTVSSYIKDLASGGLVECVKKGKFLYCMPSKEALMAIKSFADGGIAQIRNKG